MVFPWMFTGVFKQLQPLAETADLLAAKQDWGPLYDLAVLANNTVPVAAATYYDDMCVWPAALSNPYYVDMCFWGPPLSKPSYGDVYVRAAALSKPHYVCLARCPEQTILC
jgi:hypothetical protein